MANTAPSTDDHQGHHGPLVGLKVVELSGIGPTPWAAMMLGDMGADVVQVNRPGADTGLNPNARSRRGITLDMKKPDELATLRRLIDRADVLVEGYRPGVAERLGVGPQECLATNPALVYGRMTGWGQDGPMAQRAGHDINYIAMAGNLSTYARAGERPVPPMNAVGDFGGGGMLLVVGVLAALFERQRSGKGQVVDAAMIDGAALLATMVWSFAGMGMHDTEQPGTNLLDTGAHFYNTYECADGKYLAVGPIEPQFYAELVRITGFEQDGSEHPDPWDRSSWPARKQALADLLLTRSRDEWAGLFEGTDACVAPVLTMTEAPKHPHNVARGTFIERDGLVQPAPAPRFSRTPGAVVRSAPLPDEHTVEVLAEWLDER